MDSLIGPVDYEPADDNPPFKTFPRFQEDHGRKLGTLAGVAMIVGVLFPLIMSAFGEIQFLWIWEMLEEAPGSVTAYFMLTLAGGALAMVASRTLKGTRRSFAWLGIIGALLAVQLMAMTAGGGSILELPGLGSGLWMLGFVLAITGTFVGQGVARELPDWRGGYWITAFCGSVTTVLMLLPLMPDGSALISMVFDRVAWQAVWGLNFFLIFTMGHALYCQLGYASMNHHPGFRDMSLRLGKWVMYALPAYIVVTGATSEAFLPALSITVKFTGMNYGYLALLCAGLTGVIADARERRGAAPAAGSFEAMAGGGTIR